MINYDNVTKENIKEHNPNGLQITDHLYRILIIGGSVSEKTNALTNQILIKCIYMLMICMKQNTNC